jgi:hypothetical protein
VHPSAHVQPGHVGPGDGQVALDGSEVNRIGINLCDDTNGRPAGARLADAHAGRRRIGGDALRGERQVEHDRDERKQRDDAAHGALQEVVTPGKLPSPAQAKVKCES